MKALTDIQIKHLYDFTRQHYVEWYDVQSELVDHLANGIEYTWVKNPEMPFEIALGKEFKKFGILGFSGLIEEKTASLGKMYRKQIWKCFKAFFGFPKIIGTLFCMWGLFLLLSYIDNKSFIVLPFVFLIFIMYLIYMYKEKKQIKNRFEKTGKKWLVDNEFAQLGTLVNLLHIGNLFLSIFDSKEWVGIFEFILSISIVSYTLLFYISIKIVAPKLKDKVSKDYPEYNFN